MAPFDTMTGAVASLCGRLRLAAPLAALVAACGAPDDAAREDTLPQAAQEHAAGDAGAAALADADRRVDPETFADPPVEYHPWTVWWWFGNATSPDDLAFELREMRRQGIGGVEINSVYTLPAGVDAEADLEPVDLFGEAWRARFIRVLQEAEELGMAVVLRAGSGWPLGGPWIPREHSSRTLAQGNAAITGPGVRRIPLPPPTQADEWTIDALETIVAVHEGDGRRIVIAPPADGNVITWDAPAGTWRLYAFYRMFTNKQVSRAAPGGGGHVIDHYSEDALVLATARLEPLIPIIREHGPTAFKGFALDSLELHDANWTGDFLAAFEQRRGYDLTPHLPDLWRPVTDDSVRTRLDFMQTASQLQVERYFEAFTAWANGHGLKSFIQAHGSLADSIAAYGAVDVPDAESFLPDEIRLRTDIRNRKLASSAAHLYGKPVVTAESYTWLRMPRFVATLADMKRASDAIYLDGVNHIKNHGYSSSPRAVGKPGWVFYASTLINHNQTWWPHYSALASYVSRLNYVMQNAAFSADVALYHRLPDARARYDRPHRDSLIYNDAWHDVARDPGHDASAAVAEYTADCARVLRRAGVSFDIVNDDVLMRAGVGADGALAIGERSYRALVFCEAEILPRTAMEYVAEAVAGGGLVVSVGGLPARGVDEQDESGAVRAMALENWQMHDAVIAEDFAHLPHILLEYFRPALTSEGARVEFIHRHTPDADFYFIVNPAAYAVTPTIRLARSMARAQLWDPMSGAIKDIAVRRGGADDARVDIELGAHESIILAAPRDGGALARLSGEADAASGPVRMETKALTEGWTVAAGDAAPMSLPALGDLAGYPQFDAFAGMARYEKTLTLPRLAKGDIVNLHTDSFGGSVRAWLNGEPAGLRIMPQSAIDISALAREGENTLVIEVATTWNNHIMALEAAGAAADDRPVENMDAFNASTGLYGLLDYIYGPDSRRRQPIGLKSVSLTVRGAGNE